MGYTYHPLLRTRHLRQAIALGSNSLMAFKINICSFNNVTAIASSLWNGRH